MTTIKKTLKSSWTPLSNEETNNKIFEERCHLVCKWFDKWTDDQRRKILEELLCRSRPSQAEFAVDVVRTRVPLQRVDFTRALPRVVSLYIFSFLDPRSLCRSAQVCWYWKYLAEADEVWMPKAARLGWFMPPEEHLLVNPDPLCPSNLWKRFYLNKIRELQVQRPNMDHLKLTEEAAERRAQTRRMRKPMPWRGPDPRPIDTWRHNYLDNDDEIEKSQRVRHPRPSSRTRPASGKRADQIRLLRAVSTNGKLQTVVIDKSDSADLAASTRRLSLDRQEPAGPGRGAVPGMTVPTYPRPVAPAVLKVRSRTPNRTQWDPPNENLFKDSVGMKSVPTEELTPG